MTTDLSTGVCVNHPRRETALRCGKCNAYICPRCVVQTPVGARCRQCAQLRRLPQFDVGPWLLLRSAVPGLVVSLIVWSLVSLVPFLRYFLAILVGVAVGEVMSRLARRRSSRALEVTAVIVVVLGLLIVEAVRLGSAADLVSALGADQTALFGLVIPAAIASFVAVVKLR